MEEAVEVIENNIQQDLCRLCDCECDENGEMFSIFDKNEDGQEIIFLIEECLPLVVHKTDSQSKCVCADCLENLNNLFKFKMKSIDVAKKYKETGETLQPNGGHENENIKDYLENDTQNDEEKSGDEIPNKVEDEKETKTGTCDVQTSTEDITILCCNCRSEILDAHKLNKEIELCNDLHQAIAESFSRNKIITSDKMLRSRRKRSQAFYNELEDSLCSTMTEFTNTESSQCFEFQSDIDSMEDEEERPVKRRKVEDLSDPLILPVDYEKQFEEEEEYLYSPFSLLQLCLNVINKENIVEYEPDDFLVKSIEPKCSYCGKSYRNRKLLALHETTHMSIELGEKVDNPTLWHESRDDSFIRNKWLTSEDDVVEEENEMMENDTMETMDFEGGADDDEEEEESLLIPVGSGEQRDGNYEVTREVNLMDGKPYVDGLPLSDYPKEERRAFYHSMRIGGVNKRFCPLCRYSFKDNWAIESHYFSMACYYTCRYCGMRFNKQRNRFDEHVDIHVRNKDEYSTKVFAASKINNIVPKVIYPRKRNNTTAKYYADVPIPQPVEVTHFIPLNKKTLQPEGNFATMDQGPLGGGGGGAGVMGGFKFSPFGKKMAPGHPDMFKQEQFLMQPEQIRVKSEPLDYDGQDMGLQGPQPQLQTSQSKTGNQAYFCRKCYKVFFKLDEFNIHSKNCDFNQFPNSTMLGNYLSTGTKPPNGEPQQQQPQLISSSGRPVRNCAKEAGPYRDELYIPEHILRDQGKGSNIQTAQSQGPFICYICNTPFPTIYSRNSHMRIHKAENMGVTPPSTSGQSPQQRPRPMPYQDTSPYQTSVAHLAQVKQEPLDLEPEVEIHEAMGQDNFTANLSPAVSITPISKNPHQKPLINPSVMKLVQNNPQLSIKNREPQHQQQQNHNQQIQQQIQQMLSGQSDVDRTYKCSSCWEAFANKSHLYFHKKNQCEGSKYPCPFCKKRFGTEAAYSSHIFYSHPE